MRIGKRSAVIERQTDSIGGGSERNNAIGRPLG